MAERIVVLFNGNSPLNDLPRFRTWSRSKLSESDIESPFYGWKFDAQLASSCNNFEKNLNVPVFNKPRRKTSIDQRKQAKLRSAQRITAPNYPLNKPALTIAAGCTNGSSFLFEQFI